MPLIFSEVVFIYLAFLESLEDSFYQFVYDPYKEKPSMGVRKTKIKKISGFSNTQITTAYTPKVRAPVLTEAAANTNLNTEKRKYRKFWSIIF